MRSATARKYKEKVKLMYKFPYSEDNKRYHTLSFYNKAIYGAKAYKAVIEAGFTCPNIDGTKGRGGCIYCRSGSGYFTQRLSGQLYDSVYGQLCAEKKRIYEKHPNSKIVAYFQSNTNTYAPIADLREAYRAALDFGADGISIGTRADCLGNDIMELLCSINEKTKLTVELGLQTVHDKTAQIINRCCGYDEFLQGYNRLKAAGIRICLHIINGLPQESAEDMLVTAKTVGTLNPDGIKIHLLHINRGTALEKLYDDGKYAPLEKDEYIDIVARQLEYIPQETVIERLTGDGDKRYLIAPLWSRDKISVLGGIDKLQRERESYQGKALEADKK